MKKNLILLMAVTLFTACKNDKTGKDKYARDKDDYRNSDKETKDADKDKTTTDYKDDKNNNETPDNKSNKPVDKEEQHDYNASDGWPKSERNAFISSCEREAVAAGQRSSVARSYCQCMLDKMEDRYPDIKEAEKLTSEDIDRFGKMYRDKCLGGH